MGKFHKGTYSIESQCNYFEMNKSIVEYEMRPGNTVTFISEVDLSNIEKIRARALKNGLKKPSYTAFVVKAVALALKDFEYANRRVAYHWFPFRGARLQKFHAIDIGVACERLETGAAMSTFVDVQREVDKKSLREIQDWLKALSTSDTTTNKQWREFSWIISKLPPWLAKWLIRLPVFFPGLWKKYRGGAVLVSSPAKYGVDSVAATWSSPLGVSFGLVKDRPVVRAGKVVVRPTFNLTLNFDRRVMAGAQAGKFYARFVNILENAEKEMAEFLPNQLICNENLEEKIEKNNSREFTFVAEAVN